MLFLGSILAAPFRGLMAIFEEVKNAVDEEKKHDADRIKLELMDLYTQLESGRLSEAEFEAQETVLLDKLDALEGEDE